MSDAAKSLFEKLGIPLGFSVIFLAAIYFLFDKFLVQQEKIFEINQSQLEANTLVVQTVKSAMDQQMVRDEKAAELRQEHIDISKQTGDVMDEFRDLVVLTESMNIQRAKYFMHALNQLAEKDGLAPPFPDVLLRNETRLLFDESND
jgi:asparagine synthetase B (glutamine-hydrolysing)